MRVFARESGKADSRAAAVSLASRFTRSGMRPSSDVPTAGHSREPSDAPDAACVPDDYRPVIIDFVQVQ
jgi:hypothetical protein